MERGVFQAVKPPNIYGNNQYLAKDTNRIISYEANLGKKHTIPLPGIENKDSSIADIYYRLMEKTLGVQYYKIIKNDNDFYTGLGGGVQNFPYGIFILGHNGKFMEVGGAAYLGLTIDRAYYRGMWHYLDDFTMGLGPDTEYRAYIGEVDRKILHLYGGSTAYISFYWEKIAVNYAASIANPWFFVNKLPVGKNILINYEDSVSGEYDADISFSFPVLLMQDIGISCAPHKIKYRLGINQITGIKFPGQYWGLSVQMAYGW